ncbi:MAG: HDIG domain-containing protein [Anaerolineales bacterium]|nr:HDIG domain-containing protein [Anaerolineales bacterium]
MVGEDEKLYAGRWVARLRGRIIAQGGTPEQARRAAQSRYKETPEIIFMPTNFPLTFPQILDSVRTALPDGLTVYLVGGAVRDALLGRQIHDLDFVLERDAIKIARRVANTLSRAGTGTISPRAGTGTISKADFYPLDPERDTGRVIVTNEDGTCSLMDFAAFRGPDLEADILGRDFTLNAIALNLSDNTIHDPLGGAMDLKEKRLRACSLSAFADDPVRILRGVRLAANFGFHILPETRKAMKEAVSLLGNISPERMRDELFRLLDGLQPAACLRALDLLGALDKVLPELSALKGVEQTAPHVHDIWEHTLATVSHLEAVLAALAPDYNPDTASDMLNGLMVLRIGRYRQQIGETFAAPLTADRSLRSLLFLAALYHDVAKPQTKKADEEGQLRFWDHDQQGAEIAASRGRALAMSNDEATRLETVIRNHMRILFHTNRLVREGKPPSRRAVYRFFRDTGAAGVDVCLLTLADMRATYEQTLPQETWAAALDVVRLMLENWFEKPAESIAPTPLVNGDDLMRELNLQPGKIIGGMLEAIREAQAMGEVSTREQALDQARKRML